MAKQTSVFGKVSGKIGAIVYSTSAGQIIAREYNPNVANPNTPKQVNQRARMKLMSQLSASVSTEIAMKKDGLVTKRNKFVRTNMPSCYAIGGMSQITYENIQLTEGSVALTGIYAELDTTDLKVALSAEPDAKIARVVYIAYIKTDEGNLSLLGSQISTTRLVEGESTYFQQTIAGGGHIANDACAYDIVIFAYGMIDASERARAQYGNLRVTNGTDIATLISNRQISYADYQFTQTRGTTLRAGDTETEVIQDGKARVYVTPQGNGTVTGAGQYTIGTNATVQATAATGWVFSGWKINGQSGVISRNNPYTFPVEGTMDLIALFYEEDDGGGGDIG